MYSQLLGQGISGVVAVIDIYSEDGSTNEAAVMTELLREEVINLGHYQVVEKQRIDEVIAEIGFQQQGFTRESAIQLGQILSVHQVITGTLGKIDGVRFLTVRLIDVETGQVIDSATEKGFTARFADSAVKRAVYRLHGLKIPVGIDPLWAEQADGSTKYFSFYGGWSTGTILNFKAESAFRSGPAGQGVPIWAGEAAEVKSNPLYPNVGVKLGAWKRWWGGDLEISYFGHTTPVQDVFYDISGYVYLPEINDFYPIYLDTMPVPDKFIKYSSLAVGGNFFFNLPAGKIQPYVGIGGSLLMNKIVSDFPGPGNYGLGIGGEKLNSTSLGWGVFLPIGVKMPISRNRFIYAEFRFSRNYFNYISGDGFQEEKDMFTLQTFQLLLGLGRMYN